jgi:hypothetical protein
VNANPAFPNNHCSYCSLKILRDPGTDVKILKIFSPKNISEILAFFAQATASFCKNLIKTFVFEKNAIFAENQQKSKKIVIITSTPEITIEFPYLAYPVFVVLFKTERFWFYLKLGSMTLSHNF